MRSDLQRSDGCLDLAGKSLMDNILRPITELAADSLKLGYPDFSVGCGV